MSQPDTKDLIVPVPLRNISIAYRNQSYIADKIFPIVDNVAPKAKFARYLKGAWFRDEAKMRAPGTVAPRSGFPTDDIDINTKEYAFAKEVTDEDRRFGKAAGAPPLKPDQDAIEFCTDKIDLKKERRVAEIILSSTWSGVAGEDAEGLWAAADEGNTFIEDVEDQIEYIRSQTGFRPNVLMLSSKTLKEIKQEPTVLNRIKYAQKGIITPNLIAALFDLDEVLVGSAIYSIANEKKDGSDWSSQDIWEKNQNQGSAFLFYRPPAPGLKVPSAGIQARIAYENNNMPRRVSSWRESAAHQDVYEVAEETDIVQTGPDLGFLWYDTILT